MLSTFTTEYGISDTSKLEVLVIIVEKLIPYINQVHLVSVPTSQEASIRSFLVHIHNYNKYVHD